VTGHGPDVRDRRAPAPAGAGSGHVTGEPGDGAHRIAELEEMVARTHERAAELYEGWVRLQPGPQTVGLEARARRHRERAAAARSFERLAERAVQRFEVGIAAGTPLQGKARQLVVLAALECLRRLLDGRIEEVVAAGRREGASWAEIGASLRVTRQTAHERYRSRSR
jgi:hypothetical protein